MSRRRLPGDNTIRMVFLQLVEPDKTIVQIRYRPYDKEMKSKEELVIFTKPLDPTRKTE